MIAASAKLADQRRHQEERLIGAWFSPYDLLLTPVVAAPPVAALRWGHQPWRRNVLTAMRFAPWPGAWNLAGWPTLSVPAGVHPSAGTPLSAQLVAPAGGETLLLSIAAQIEQAHPWPRLAPAYR